MTTIDTAISAIAQVQNDLAQLTQFLYVYQIGQTNGMNVDRISLKTTIQTLATKTGNDIDAAKTAFQNAVLGL